MAAKVFKTGLLEDASSADIGWSRVPLGRLHGERGLSALDAAGVAVRTGERVRSITGHEEGDDVAGQFVVQGDGWNLEVDSVVVALPHDEAATVLPAGVLEHQDRIGELGSSAVIDVHLVFDREVTHQPLMAAVRSPVQWVFDRSEAAGVPAGRQYLAVSISGADELLGRRPEELIASTVTALEKLVPAACGAAVVDSLVTKERKATFAAVPGSGLLRPPQATKLPGLSVAGAWTDTGWPATMEGAVRSGVRAARASLAAEPSPGGASTYPNPSNGRSLRTESVRQEVA
jgi:uncharacterized protein with NAD-binding domain and iron-sulfur cluster